jgi:hypothetical protein
MKNKATIGYQKMPAPNGRFGASGGVARLTVCADYQCFAPVRAAVETPTCRQAASTLSATRVQRVGLRKRTFDFVSG